MIDVTDLNTTNEQTELQDACGIDTDWLCQKIFELTDSSDIAALAGFVVDKPVKIILIVVLALVVRRIVHRGIDGLIERLMQERKVDEQGAVEEVESTGTAMRRDILARKLSALHERSERARQRAKTLGVLLRVLHLRVLVQSC